MRILQVHNRYRSATPGGEDRVVDQEAAALADRGHAIERFERFNDDIDSWPVWRRAMLPGQVLWSESAKRSLTRAIDRFRPDVVHIHNTFPQLSPSVLYACRARQVPAVVTLHNFRLMCASSNLFRDGRVCHDCVGRLPAPAVRHGCYDSSMRTLPVAAANVAHAHAWRTLPSAYIVISDYQRRVLAPFGLPSERVFVKANLVPSAIAPEEPVATQPIVVFAGRLGAEKGADVLMDAWSRFAADRDPSLRLVIAGTGPLQDQVTEWSSRHRSVDLVGLLSRSDCAALIASARAAIIASACEETFGLVAVEAMACGVPPVAPAFGSFPELVRHERDGVLYQPGDADALAHVLRDVEGDPDRFAAYGREAREAYESRFDPDVNIGELVAIYERAVARPAHATAS